MLFDTHTHLNDEAFATEIPEAIARAKENDVTKTRCSEHNTMDWTSLQQGINILKLYL